MAISGILGPGGSLFGQAVQNINRQLTNLSTQLATGKISTTYSGFGANEGFAIAARSQLSDISAFTTTITNVNTVIDSANTALQSFSTIAGQVQSGAASGAQDITSTGQTIAQQNGLSQLTGLVGILNTQVGDRFIFSGSAINTPAVAPADTILNGSGTQAGLKQVIAERAQADGTTGLGRLVITQPTATSVSVAEDVAGSPFGLKLSSVSSNLTGATVTGPSGSPAAISIALGATNPKQGDQVNITFNLPDGTTDSVQLTASNSTPLPADSFAIGATPAQTAANLNAALNTAIGTLANTSLVAASAVEAGHDFFDAGTATGSAVNNQGSPPAPITGATTLSGAAGTDSLASGFAPGDFITVNGTQITFVASGATGNELNVTDSVQTLLSKIDQVTGTSTPSTVSGGVITLHTEDASNLSVTSSNPSQLASLGLQPVTATQVSLRVSGSPLSSATSLVSDPTNTVAWYTGNSSPSPRASSTARIDSNIVVAYGAQANEQAIRTQLEGVAVFAAVTVSPTAANSSATIAALSQRIATNLTPQPGQQTIADIQTDFANAQNTMKEATDRQTQTQTLLQNIVDQTETASTQQVASQILALQTTLQASYETTSMLAGLTLTKFLLPGG
ncbi:MAG TPA: flagellar protein [Bradyrhizobium sp.]|uniref:flagellar protein n=1 Tax=Bradyrhizobium sp. TaxID=376 RepID=UPI002B809CC5|nr:flagellar protein [Bradyrhizobium sp.]HXB77974.1 flagellar protein [Bradyrhizobium sp.]